MTTQSQTRPARTAVQRDAHQRRARPHPDHGARTVGIVLLAVQTALFATAVVFGVQRTPAAYLFKTLVRPRLAAPAHLEDPQPPRFAQGVGLVFAPVGLVGYLSGATLLGAIATGFALAAALLNAVFGFCLGCEMYLLIRRIAPARSTPSTPTPDTPNRQTREHQGRRGST